jgi:hypothetical protein
MHRTIPVDMTTRKVERETLNIDHQISVCNTSAKLNTLKQDRTIREASVTVTVPSLPPLRAVRRQLEFAP